MLPGVAGEHARRKTGTTVCVDLTHQTVWVMRGSHGCVNLLRSDAERR